MGMIMGKTSGRFEHREELLPYFEEVVRELTGVSEIQSIGICCDEDGWGIVINLFEDANIAEEDILEKLPFAYRYFITF